MGQKVNPHGLRVGVIKGWDTQWYADKKDFGAFLKEDYEIRKFIKDTYYASAIPKSRSKEPRAESLSRFTPQDRAFLSEKPERESK